MLPKTTTLLLADLAASENQESWREFDCRYRPVLTAFARRLGMNDDEAAEVAQETLIRAADAIRRGQYQPQKGRLRSWVIGITKNCIADLHRRRGIRREQRGLSAMEDLPDDHTLSAIWDRECEQSLLAEGLRRVRESTHLGERTLHIFELLVIKEHSPPEVATMLGVSRNEVYLAKHRCLNALKESLEDLREAYEID
jgi:RNA polymerase sigma-70 factor (ECF subfamily)